MQNGFLPEPIPTVEVSEERIRLEAEKLQRGATSLPNTRSPLFEKAKEETFRRTCASMTIEQSMARFPDVYESGLADANINVSMDAVRALAKSIGESQTLGRIPDMLDDARLFRQWIHAVIKTLAGTHLSHGVDPEVVVSVPHLDLPLDGKDDAHVAIVYRSIYDDEAEEYKTVAHVISIPWPGRHVLRVNGTWVDYIVCLMRQVCSLTD